MAGTITSAYPEATRDGVRRVVLTCTADAADGSFPEFDLTGLEGTLLAVQTNPGATAPTDNYDVTLVDGDGLDRFNGVGLNRDTTTSERVVISGAPFVAIGEALTLTITGNSVNSAVIVITIYYVLAGFAGAGGDATAANQVTGNASLADIVTAIQILDNAVAGNEYQVDVVTSTAERSATGTVTSVADTATSTTLLASNASRKGHTIYNDSTVTLYVKHGATASTTSFTVPIAAGGFYESPASPIYTGIIDGIWASDAAGSARITEYT